MLLLLCVFVFDGACALKQRKVNHSKARVSAFCCCCVWLHCSNHAAAAVVRTSANNLALRMFFSSRRGFFHIFTNCPFAPTFRRISAKFSAAFRNVAVSQNHIPEGSKKPLTLIPTLALQIARAERRGPFLADCRRNQALTQHPQALALRCVAAKHEAWQLCFAAFALLCSAASALHAKKHTRLQREFVVLCAVCCVESR